MTSTPCPVCGADRWDAVLRLPAVPVAVGALMARKSVAVAATRGDIDLACCRGCGLIHNLAFDPNAVDYTADYDNSQFCSATFTRYAGNLVTRLVDRYGLAGGTVVDIGCGQGELLELFLRAGVGHAIGVDPAYAGEPGELERQGRLRIIRDRYVGQLAEADADLWCCRHVLEHVSDPADLLTRIRDDAGERAAVYLEVPSGDFVLGDAGLWDVIYPHVSYFTATALHALVERCGFDVLEARSAFGGQFLSVEARRARRATAPPATDGRSAGPQMAAMSDRFERVIDRWDTLISERQGHGSTVVWGAGAKSVTFLNSTVAGEIVDVVVDLNPRKHGSYIPGTGQEIIGPEALRDVRPATVVVMNANYEPEIRAQLLELGLDPEVLCA